MRDKIWGAIAGLSVGDALGVPVEFSSRHMLAQNPVTDMLAYGTHQQPAGTWSDDTTLTLCLLDSLAGGLNYADLMEKFRLWLYEGHYTPYGEVFDVGIATSKAISRYAGGTSPVECGGKAVTDNGNGSLMRILPLAFDLRIRYGRDYMDHESAYGIIHDISDLTHQHTRSHIACGIYLAVAGELINGVPLKNAIRSGISRAASLYRSWGGGYPDELEHYKRLTTGELEKLPDGLIQSSGYVVDTLEAALWCLLNTDSYEACVLAAVNLGEDTDTVAAVSGGLAGIYYGPEAIPAEWMSQLVKQDEIRRYCETFHLSLQRREAAAICAYIPYLEQSTADSVCRWVSSKKTQDGSITMPYPVYEDRLMQFAECFSQSSFVDFNYRNTCKIKGAASPSSFQSWAETADLELIQAMLTYCIRNERFCDGAWAAAVGDGTFLALLRRLRDLHQVS